MTGPIEGGGGNQWLEVKVGNRTVHTPNTPAMQDMVKRIDSNGDGEISFTEASRKGGPAFSLSSTMKDLVFAKFDVSNFRFNDRQNAEVFAANVASAFDQQGETITFSNLSRMTKHFATSTVGGNLPGARSMLPAQAQTYVQGLINNSGLPADDRARLTDQLNATIAGLDPNQPFPVQTKLPQVSIKGKD